LGWRVGGSGSGGERGWIEKKKIKMGGGG